MFTVDYEVGGAAQQHDHPFEEAYVFLAGRDRGRVRRRSLHAPRRATSCSRRSDRSTASTTRAPSGSAGSRPRPRNHRRATPIAGGQLGTLRDLEEVRRHEQTERSSSSEGRGPSGWSSPAITWRPGARSSSPGAIRTNIDAAVAELGGRAHGRALRPRRAGDDRRRAGRRRPGPAPGARGHRSRPEHGRRLRPRQGHPAGHAQARRLHGGRPRAPWPTDRRRVGAAVRRHGQGAAVSRARRRSRPSTAASSG